MDIDSFIMTTRKRLEAIESAVGISNSEPGSTVMQAESEAVRAFNQAGAVYHETTSELRAFMDTWSPLLIELQTAKQEYEKVQAQAAATEAERVQREKEEADKAEASKAEADEAARELIREGEEQDAQDRAAEAGNVGPLAEHDDADDDKKHKSKRRR